VSVAPILDPEERPGLRSDVAARVAELFERHGRMVYGVCRAMLRHVHDAEDATQQVFLSAHRALLSGTRVRDAGAWLATIARNECRSRITTGMRTPLSVGEDDLATIAAHGDEAERRIQADALRDALVELPERQREAFVLRYLYGLRYGEVAKALGLSRPATEALLFRARRTMRIRLRPVVGAVLVVPLAVREELAAAIPGFAPGPGTSAATAGAAGGLLAKLTAGPVGAKVAATAIAVSTVGTVGAVGPDRSARDASSRGPIVASVVENVASMDVESSSDDDSDGQSGSSQEAEDLGGDDDQSSSGGSNDLHDDRVLMESDDEREGQEDAGSSGSSTGADDGIGSGGSSELTESSDSSGPSSSDDTTDDSSGPETDSSGSGSSDSSGSGSEGSGDTESGHGEESSESSESESDSESSGSGEGP